MSMDTIVQSIPVRRTGEPEDIANACAWLCTEASSYVSGQTIGVNGGRVRST
jgi:2-hydroxycyclohexanecarboxyl-CoA dehydrogenase